uniref:glucan endo-1,3-beta-D-glucosidase n=1 Tax=Craspedostauros australis TaxID=1486917 RepID=A0A7R9WNG1_9STRA
MNVGRLLTATEVRSAQRYWHVVQNDEALRIYPKQYTHKVVGIVWSTMAQFGTWFGNAGYLPYGIQLLPLTSISEQRDNLQWVNEMYDPLSRACGKDFKCTLDGWSFLSLAMLATVGHRDTAMVSLNELPAEAYESAGGNGHSKTNTLWYIATRPKVGKPVKMTEYDIRGQGEKRPAPSFVLTDCYRPGTCTDEVLDKSAGKYTCRERMQFLIDDLHNSQWGACATVAGIEFPNECGHCDPSLEDGKTQHANKTDTGPDGEPDFDNDSKMCPPCSKEQCSSDLNRCPASEHVFVCTEGSNTGGCSGHPWPTDQGNCNACCEMTECYKWKDEEAGKVGLDFDLSHCPPCEKSICYGNLNQCPIHDAPFLCMEGTSIGGCSSVPWDVTSVGADCASCCQVTIDC